MKSNKTRNFILFILILGSLFFSGCKFPASEQPGPIPTPTNQEINDQMIQLIPAGDILYTHIHSPENGKIAVRVDLPVVPRYGNSAPIVVVASTWFVEKYNLEETPFHLVYNPVDVGAISVTHLWPGKTDPETQISSDGSYDFGGPKSLAALRDTIRFALGLIPDINGLYLHELISVDPLYNNVGLFASSHAGVVATNVMAYHGDSFPGLKYFVGRENPTMAEMYPLEIGHFNELRQTKK